MTLTVSLRVSITQLKPHCLRTKEGQYGVTFSRGKNIPCRQTTKNLKTIYIFISGLETCLEGIQSMLCNNQSKEICFSIHLPQVCSSPNVSS